MATKTKATQKRVKYTGIADAHGIESFVPEAEGRGLFFGLRASCNRQRHAVHYTVALKPAQVKAIEAELGKKDFIGALEMLQTCAAFGAPLWLGGGGDVIASWSLIPNPKLDPWR